jgi:hypothetical protein
MRLPLIPLVAALAAGLLSLVPASTLRAAAAFDHEYAAYADVLKAHVGRTGVDYRGLVARRAPLDLVVDAFGAVPEQELRQWTRAEQMAFWINAYNALTLRVIVDHYPIRGGWFSLSPRNSIRQIDGAWDRLQWTVAGRQLTLDDIEHRILRPTFREPLVHVAINCASVGCPPLAREPYRAETLEAQLSAAATRYLASPQGLVVSGDRLVVSSIFKWYGEDFVERYAGEASGSGSPVERAIRGVIAAYGPPAARTLAGRSAGPIRFLPYDWSLNEHVDTP